MIYIPILKLVPQGGVRVLVDIANDQTSRGRNVVIVTSTLDFSIPFYLSEKVTIRQTSKYKSKYLSYIIFLLKSPFYMKDGLIIANYFVTYYVSIVASFIFNLKIIYFVQGIESIRKGTGGWILNQICRASYNSKNIIVTNKYLYEWLKANYNTPMLSIDIGVSDQFIYQEFEICDKKYDVIYFARDEDFKRIDRFYKVAELVDNVNFLVISQDYDLISKIKSKYKNMDFAMPKNTFELIKHIDSVKMVLYTSEYEGFGLPPLECMARKVPAVVFHNDGIAIYCVNNSNSIIVYSEEEAVNAIYKILKSKYFKDMLSTNAYKTALGFRLSKSLDKLNEIIDRSGLSY
jgi:glycosyltransferase involved in cell wall biosynthesis